ncbi:MAG: hypothetical protein ACYC91_17160, partial [Solirubrobacteraceae bacterium]
HLYLLDDTHRHPPSSPNKSTRTSGQQAGYLHNPTNLKDVPLGHETLDTTNKYLHADMELKRRAVNRTTPPNVKAGRYRPPDRLLAFLEPLTARNMLRSRARSPPQAAAGSVSAT